MACDRVALPGGGVAIVCGPRRRARPCADCGAPSAFLCDGPGRGGTCDRPLCGRCRIHVPPGRDFCRAHRAAAADAAAQPGVDHVARVATVQFTAHDRIVKFEITLPDPNDPKYKRMKNSYHSRNAAGVAKVVEQETRTRWRALLLVIKAKLEAIESGISTFEEEFLAHVLLPNQQTVGAFVGPMIDRIYATGRMPAARQLEAGDVDAEVIDAPRGTDGV